VELLDLVLKICDIICTQASFKRGIRRIFALVTESLSLEGMCLFMPGQLYFWPEGLDTTPYEEALKGGGKKGFMVFTLPHGKGPRGDLVVKKGDLSPNDELLLQVVAGQLSQFLRNLQSKRELKVGSRLLLDLYSAGRELGSTLDREEMGKKLAHFAKRFSRASYVSVTLFDTQGNRTFSVGETKEKGDLIQYYNEDFFKRRVVSLESLNGKWGVMELYLPQKVSLSRYQKRVIHILAELAGTFLENIALYERLKSLVDDREKRIRFLSILYQVGNAYRMTSELRKRALLSLRALTDPHKGLGLPQAFLFLLHSSAGCLKGLMGISWVDLSPWGEGDWEIDEEYLRRVESSPAFVDIEGVTLPDHLSKELEKGEILYLSDAVEYIPFCERGKFYVGLPLMSGKTLVGALVVGKGVPLEAEEMQFLTMFSHQLALALESARLQETLKKTSKDLEEAQKRLFHSEKLATLGELAARVAHDLKNPLVAIGGFARRLHSKMAEDCPDKVYTRIILKEVEEAEKILSDVLSYSKVPQLKKSLTDINALLDDVLFLYAEELRDRNIIVVKKLDRTLPAVYVDPPQIRQVFMNLISNALQAIGKKGAITVSTSRVVKDGRNMVKIEVSDTGGGIPEKDLPNIFNPFFTTKSTGTGLGLSIVKRIVELHGGEIEVVNNFPVGVAFLVFLPLEGEKDVPGEKPQG